MTKAKVIVRNTEERDFPGIVEMSAEVYHGRGWSGRLLASHLKVFPAGQLVAVEVATQKVLGTAASLIVHWDDYDMEDDWFDFTEGGTFTNHDPENGRTLYGAEVMVDPDARRLGVGSRLYTARRNLARRLKLRRIRAASRLRGYHKHAQKLSAAEYVKKVIGGEIKDPTLSFQIKNGFRVIAVVAEYLPGDPESLGHAAVIEWLNDELAAPDDFERQQSRFHRE